MCAFATTMLISYAAHAYVHEHYHLNRSWLDRWQWFRWRRSLHFVHHRDTTRNYAVIDFFWDRMLRTYTPALSEDSRSEQ